MTYDRVDSILEQWASERPDLDASPIGIFGRISRIDRLFEQSMAEFLRPFGLTLGLFDVLAALRRIGEPFQAMPSDLAAMTMLTSGGMTGRLDQLEKLDLVLRVPDPDDRRVMMAQLSPKGRDLIDPAHWASTWNASEPGWCGCRPGSRRNSPATCASLSRPFGRSTVRGGRRAWTPKRP